VHHENVVPSHLPSISLPCVCCGNRMAITASAPAPYENGTGSNDLEDITHTCVQCGMMLISTRRRAGVNGLTPHRSRVEHHGRVRRSSHRQAPRKRLLRRRSI
jgi:hypothetical protein